MNTEPLSAYCKSFVTTDVTVFARRNVAMVTKIVRYKGNEKQDFASYHSIVVVVVVFIIIIIIIIMYSSSCISTGR